MNGDHWGIPNAAELVAELERELADRRRFYPGMVDKGRMLKADADYQLAIFAEILADLAVAFGPPPWILAAPRFAWGEKVKALWRELELRRRFYPDRIAKGRMTQDQAHQQFARLEAVHTLYWHQMFGWPKPDENWLQAVRDHQALVATETTPQEAML